MSLDPAYLEYPKRREGMDHDLYPASNLFTRPPAAWPDGKSVAVAILVNRQLVAQVKADLAGKWSFRLTTPLPTGAVALAVGCYTDKLPERQATPVVVMVLTNPKGVAVHDGLDAHNALVTRPPQSLAQMPPKKLYYPVQAGP